jgi:hypothetical protein
MDDLLASSDWVVLSTPLTAATRGLIGASALRRMKPGAVLVNLGRGALVDEDALVAAPTTCSCTSGAAPSRRSTTRAERRLSLSSHP